MDCIRLHELAEIPKLTKEELRNGVILFYCKKCLKTTKHQTVNEKGKPFAPRYLGPRWKESKPFKHRRMCLNCRTETMF